MAQINNTAEASYGFGRSGLGDTTSNVATTNLIQEHSIEIEKTSLNSSFRPGENITYLLTITNNGSEALTNVQISDNLGGGSYPLAYVDASARLIVDGEITLIVPTDTQPLEFTIAGPIASGDQVILIYIARVNPTLSMEINSITNTVTASADRCSEPATTCYTISLAEFAELSINKEVSDDEINVGQQFSYILTLSNTGNIEANNVVITDVLPENFEITSITSQTGGVTTNYNSGDYDLDPSDNKLTLPNGSGTPIVVPAASGGTPGTTVITITGSITE